MKTDPKWPFGHLEQPAAPPLPAATAEPAELLPLDFFLEVMRDETKDLRIRIQVASFAAPFMHAKKGESGKKEEKDAAAKKAHSKFAPSAPPKLVAAGGKKV